MPAPRADTLIARDAELAELRAALAGAEAGQGSLVLIVGEPGIGKTALADTFARDAVRLGAALAWGRAWEAGGAPPFWPWIEVLRALPLEAEVAPRRPGAKQSRGRQ